MNFDFTNEEEIFIEELTTDSIKIKVSLKYTGVLYGIVLLLKENAPSA